MSLRLLLLTVLSFVLYFVSFRSGRQSYALKITFNIALCTFLPCYILGFKIKRWFWINCLLLSSIIGLIFPHLIFQWKVLPVYHVTLIRYNSSRDASLQILTVISFCDNLINIGIACVSCGTKGVLIWENLHQGEFHTEMTSWFCIAFTCLHVFSLSHDQHDDVILNCQIMHALPSPVYQQTNFTLKQVVVSHLHDTVTKFCTWVKFSLWFYSRGDLMMVWHDILWWYHVNKYRAMRGNRSELSLAQKLPGCHVNTP